MTPETTSRTIVVGYDGSPAALAAVEHAIDRAGPDGPPRHRARLPGAGRPHRRVLLQLRWSTTPPSTPQPCSTASSVTASASPRSRTSATSPSDPPRPAIVGAAEVHEADEIVIGSRGVGRVRALLGSVAHDVIHHARCPVTVIPERMVELQTRTPVAVASAV